MSNGLPILIVLNVAFAGGIVFFASGNSSADESKADSALYNISLKEGLEEDEFKSGSLINAKDKVGDRKERLSARFFLPAMGERNAFTDMVDGLVVENIKRRSPIVKSFEKLLKEENPEIEKEELEEQKKKFNSIVSDYLRKVYRIQRGLEQEGSIEEHRDVMKAEMGQELSLAGARLARLREIESEDKANRQIGVFEKLLIRDRDKLSNEQKSSLREILRNQQTTVFDAIPGVDESYKKSDQVLQQVGGVLNPDQSSHFKYFQEYHWHSYDMQELNDMPMF
ncbi:MAG: hypothetical protein NE328_11315 [Lentisphaeraceae bacterium]|nr:hypothetical protein [Lentisphaeraceae bacterium]